jgi:hypothetical protein
MTTYINVPVPEEHVPKVYELLARLDSGEVAPETPVDPPPASPLTEELVTRMYRESEPTHRALMEHLAENAGEWSSSGDLIKVLGLGTGRRGMAGVFGAFGRRAAHRYDGRKPWEAEWDAPNGEYTYMMEPEVAAWIKTAAAS